MFLLVSGHHVGAHTDGHQHDLSIQISINLGKKFLRISCIRKIAVTRILEIVFAYLPSFISQILDFIYWTVLILILIYFEWRDTENYLIQYVDNKKTWRISICVQVWQVRSRLIGEGTSVTQGSGPSMEFLSTNFLQSASTQTYALPCLDCWVLGHRN